MPDDDLFYPEPRIQSLNGERVPKDLVFLDPAWVAQWDAMCLFGKLIRPEQLLAQDLLKTLMAADWYEIVVDGRPFLTISCAVIGFWMQQNNTYFGIQGLWECGVACSPISYQPYLERYVVRLVNPALKQFDSRQGFYLQETQ